MELFKHPNLKIDVIMVTSTIVDEARNKLIEQALDRKCDLIWMIDSDSMIQKGTFEKLLKHDADFVSGLYFSKGYPFHPIVRVEKDGMSTYLHDIEFGKVYEVQGVGLGCALVKTSIFDGLEKPYFKFEYKRLENGMLDKVSEDIYLCNSLRKKGVKILLDTNIIIGHEGGTITDFEYRANKPFLVKISKMRDQALEDYSEFAKISLKQAWDNFRFGLYLYADEFNLFFKDKKITNENLIKFYKTAKYSIPDLLYWHLGSEKKMFDTQLVNYLKNKYDKNIEILDFGCGAGINASQLSQEGFKVTGADLDGKMLNFFKFRCKKHNIKMNFIELPFKKPIKKKFDVILALDVLEHIHDSEFENTINLIKSLKKPNGEVIVTAPFGKTSIHPMHFENSSEKEKMIREL